MAIEARYILPKYKCLKVVSAGKVLAIALDTTQAKIDERETDGTATLRLDCGRVQVSGAYLKKHSPEIGGYYVVYEDGCESFSLAKAFEEGYIRI